MFVSIIIHIILIRFDNKAKFAKTNKTEKTNKKK